MTLTAAPPAGLRLTRRAIAAFANWHEKTGRARRDWEQACGLHPDEVRALETLLRNLRGCGPPVSLPDLQAGRHNGGWFHRDGLRPEIARQLLAELFVPEEVLPDLVRIVGVVGWHERWLETGLGDALAPAWEWDRAELARRRAARESERLAREAVRQAMEEARLQSGPPERSPEPEEATEMTAVMETAPQNGARPRLERPANLPELQREVWEELERRGLDIRDYISWTEKIEIGKALQASAGSVQQAMEKLCARLGTKLPKATKGTVPDCLPEAQSSPPPVLAEVDAGPGRLVFTPADIPTPTADGANVPAESRLSDDVAQEPERDPELEDLFSLQSQVDALRQQNARLTTDLITEERGRAEDRAQLKAAHDQAIRERDAAIAASRAEQKDREAPVRIAEPLTETERVAALQLATCTLLLPHAGPGAMPSLFEGMDIARRLEVVLLAADLLAVAVDA